MRFRGLGAGWCVLRDGRHQEIRRRRRRRLRTPAHRRGGGGHRSTVELLPRPCSGPWLHPFQLSEEAGDDRPRAGGAAQPAARALTTWGSFPPVESYPVVIANLLRTPPH